MNRDDALEVLKNAATKLKEVGIPNDVLDAWEAVLAALESEEVVAEGLADPDALADYNAGRQQMLTIFKVRALHTDKRVRILAAKEGEE